MKGRLLFNIIPVLLKNNLPGKLELNFLLRKKILEKLTVGRIVNTLPTENWNKVPIM